MPAAAIAERVTHLVRDHDSWRAQRSLNLNAAENMLSPGARALLASDLATRVTEGIPGDKEFPAPEQNRFVDEIEAIIIALVQRMFGVRYVDWRAASTSMANATVLFALTRPGDPVLVQGEANGGNYSYNDNGTPRLAALTVHPLPASGALFEIDPDAAREVARVVRPRVIVVGGSNVLFPYPVRELKAVADEVGAVLVYDAAHLALLIAAGIFQDPLREGASILTSSTHKVLSGAVGGLVMTDDESIAARVRDITFPAFLQTRDQNKYAATAYALAEMTAFGGEYARQMVANARSLADALVGEGFEVLGQARGFTSTHQLFLCIPPEAAADFEPRCQAANLLVTKAQRMGASGRVAARLTTQEITRLGFGTAEMATLARWFGRLLLATESPERIAIEIETLLERYPSTAYTFRD